MVVLPTACLGVLTGNRSLEFPEIAGQTVGVESEVSAVLSTVSSPNAERRM